MLTLFPKLLYLLCIHIDIIQSLWEKMATNNLLKLDKEYRRGLTSLGSFSEIIQEINQNQGTRFIIDLSDYKHIHPSFAVLVAAMLYVNDKSAIRYSITNQKCIDFLYYSGILEHYKKAEPRIGKKQKTSDIRKSSVNFQIVDDINNCEDIARQIIKRFPVELDQEIENELISNMVEILSNAFYHSGYGKAFCCGFIDVQKNMTISIYDLGIGIPNKVREFLGNDNLSAKGAIEWAWQMGHSTLNGADDYPRGVGFPMLEDFVKKNNGDILVGSDNSYCRIRSGKKTFGELATPLPGTFFSLQIRKDSEHKYKKDRNSNIIIEEIGGMKDDHNS